MQYMMMIPWKIYYNSLVGPQGNILWDWLQILQHEIV